MNVNDSMLMMLHSLPSILLVVLFVNDNFSLDLRITLFGEKMFLIKLNLQKLAL